MARLIRCERCRVNVPADQLDARRCLDRWCWLPAMRMANAKHLGQLADHLAALTDKRVERMATKALKT